MQRLAERRFKQDLLRQAPTSSGNSVRHGDPGDGTPESMRFRCVMTLGPGHRLALDAVRNGPESLLPKGPKPVVVPVREPLQKGGAQRKAHASIALQYEQFKPDSVARFLALQPQLPLRPYQETGVAFLLRRADDPLRFADDTSPTGNQSAILADEMRMGKTLETLVLALKLIQRAVARGEPRFGQPILCVAKGDQVYDWANEIRRLFPAQALAVRTLTTHQDRWNSQILHHTDIILTNYSSLTVPRLQELFYAPTTRFRMIAFDEAHVLVNAATDLHRLATRLVSSYKLLISGTLVQNTQHQDMVGALTVLGVPRHLILRDEALVKHICDRIYLARDRRSVGLDDGQGQGPAANRDRSLPVTWLTYASEAEARLYDAGVDNFAHLYDRELQQRKQLQQQQNTRGPARHIVLLKAINNLRRIASAPHTSNILAQLQEAARLVRRENLRTDEDVRLFDIVQSLQFYTACGQGSEEDFWRDAGPAPPTDPEWKELRARVTAALPAILPPLCTKEQWVVSHLLHGICEPRGEKAVVFSNWVGSLERLYSIQRERYHRLHATRPSVRDAVLVTGKIPEAERPALFYRFERDDNVGLLLVTLEIGAEGRNFVCANHFVIYDPWYNPQPERQAGDRGYGAEQRRQVHVYRLAMTNTVDTFVIETSRKKEHIRVPQSAAAREEQVVTAQLAEAIWASRQQRVVDTESVDSDFEADAMDWQPTSKLPPAEFHANVLMADAPSG